MEVTRILRSHVVLASITATLIALSPAVARPQDAQRAPDDDDARLARIAGVWRLDGSEADARRVVDAAVDQAAAAMGFFVSAFAGPRLREGTPIHRSVELELDADRVTVRFGSESYTTALGRTEVRRNPRGETMRVTQRLRPNGQLEQVFETDQGLRRYVYTPLRDGRLRISTTTDSPRMPQPMFFMLDYRRSDMPPARATR